MKSPRPKRHPPSQPAIRRVEPYSALASVYDLVMAHVDYDEWAGYIHGLLLLHGETPRRLLELGCGTGSIGLALLALTDFEYTGLDASAEMVGIASQKAASLGYPADWIVADYTDFEVEEPFDVVLLLYDGLNYSVDAADVVRLFQCAARALRPGGLLLVDQSTHANSENNAEYFNDTGGDSTFRYIRSSSYDVKTSIHRTVFEIQKAGEVFEEVHIQRAYAAGDISAIFEGVGFRIEAAYDGFSLDEPVEGSERIQWVARAPGSHAVVGTNESL